MNVTRAAERRALSAPEWEAVERTHHPAIGGVEPEELGELRGRVRAMRDKARDRLNQQRRELRGKGSPRGAQPAADDAGSALKLRILSAALKRVNKEQARLGRRSGRRSQAELSRAALATKRAGRAPPRRPNPGRTADEGMASHPNSEIAPSGALNEEGHRPVIERSRKAR